MREPGIGGSGRESERTRDRGEWERESERTRDRGEWELELKFFYFTRIVV